MANWGQKVYPSDYSEIKALLKAEIGRRGKTEGTARGQSVGSMASYNGSAYDFSTQPKAGAYMDASRSGTRHRHSADYNQ